MRVEKPQRTMKTQATTVTNEEPVAGTEVKALADRSRRRRGYRFELKVGL